MNNLQDFINLISPAINKYFKWYWNIIENAKSRINNQTIYTENHHIIPKCFISNEELIILTAKEHYMVHLLLWWGLRAEYGTKNDMVIKMNYAFIMMSTTNQEKRKLNNAKEYEFIKIAVSERGCTDETRKKLKDIFNRPEYKKIVSETHKDKIVSEETCKKLSIAHKDQKPTEEHKANLRVMYAGSGHPQSKVVYQYDENWIFLRTFACCKDADAASGGKSPQVSAICRCVNVAKGPYRYAYEMLNSPEEVADYEYRMKNRKVRSYPSITEEKRTNLSQSHIGQVPWNKGKTGFIPWNKGLTKETDERIANRYKNNL